MARRDVAIEIIAPTEGLHLELPNSMITPRSTPHVGDCNAYYGMVQKDYGTTLFCTGSGGISSTLGAPVTLLYEAPYPAETTLQLFSESGMYKYSGGLDAFVVDGQSYGGTVTDYWSACMHNNVLIYANKSDLVQYKPAYNSTGTNMGGVATSSYKAVAVVSFAGHLNLYNVTEGGNDCPKRVRWTKSGLLAYSNSDWTSGTAGFLDVQDVDGEIMTALGLANDSVVMYGENSIHQQVWVGGGAVYAFTKMITNKGTPSKRGVVANGAVHYMLTDDNIYEYHGGRDLRSIGDPIKSEYVSLVNHSALQYAFIDYIKEDDELRVHVPTGANTHPDKVYICKVKDNYAWYSENRPYTGKGTFTRPSALTIGELTGSLGAQNWKFGDLCVAAGAPVHLRGDKSGRVVKRDKTVYSISESGTAGAQTFVFDTKDISSIGDLDPMINSRASKFEASRYMDSKSRWLKLKVEAKGQGSMHLSYSTDGGDNFTAFDASPITLDASWDMYQLDVDRANPGFMVRVSNSGINEVVHIRYIKLQLVPGGENS